MEFTNRERGVNPPVHALDLVARSFAGHPSNSLQGEECELVQLVFDSASQLAAPGLRATSSVVRQLLYRAGDVCIDMRMQPRLGSESTFLIGQLLKSSQPEHGLSGIPVSLLREGKTLSLARTNDVGEFDFNIVDCGSEMQLVVGMAERRKIVVPLPTTEKAPPLT